MAGGLAAAGASLVDGFDLVAEHLELYEAVEAADDPAAEPEARLGRLVRTLLDAYRDAVPDAHLRETIIDRVRLRDPFNYLRGISWSAMGWVAYQTRFSGMKNPDTWAKLQQYMNLEFIRSLFDPFIQNKSF